MATSSMENLVAQQELLLVEHGASWSAGRARQALLVGALRGLFRGRRCGENSSKLEIVCRLPARARMIGSGGISCGCGKRSSMYSLMMLDS